MVFLEDQALQDLEPNEMSDLTPNFSVTETQGHRGDTEEYDDTVDDAIDDDDG